jgi:thymidylate kinase
MVRRGNIPKQDLTLILDIKPETSLKRNANPDAYENLGFLKLVWKNYINLNNYYPYGDKIYIEGEDDPCTVNFTLLSVVNDYLEGQV